MPVGRLQELTANQTSEEEGVDGQGYHLEAPEVRGQGLTGSPSPRKRGGWRRETGLGVDERNPDPVVPEEGRTGSPEDVHFLSDRQIQDGRLD